MFNRICVAGTVVAGILSLPACAQDRYTTDSMAVLVNKQSIKAFVTDPKLRELRGEKLVEAFKDYSGLTVLNGFDALIARNLDGIRDNFANPGNPPSPDGDARCEQARKEKKAWHEDNTGTVPDAFGKIVHWGVNPRHGRPASDPWTGDVHVCTWIGKNEYYFEMAFVVATENADALHAQKKDGRGTFPNTLDFDNTGPIDLSRWNWKLHANARSMGFIVANENGNPIPATDDLFKQPSQNCFDAFFVDVPPTAQQGLPPQWNFCMGRCDGRIMNTGDG